ncbi:hypothetical protein [Microvirga roseola]|uniref:hypothetical protein n=1 Tax=Microvirga roseola TaxID=2883126 RepID=UPI001E4D562D|nr:hypothetical protein [Microvirga roseola]
MIIAGNAVREGSDRELPGRFNSPDFPHSRILPVDDLGPLGHSHNPAAVDASGRVLRVTKRRYLEIACATAETMSEILEHVPYELTIVVHDSVKAEEIDVLLDLDDLIEVRERSCRFPIPRILVSGLCL